MAPTAGTAAALLTLTDLHKNFGAQSVVDGVSLEIHAGEFFSIIGASGCGKTTLLRMIAGLETPSAGRIVIDGIDVTRTPAYRRPVNMMFQSYALFPHMSVANNIAFGLQQERMPAAQIRERVAQMLALVQMQDYAERRPDQLSGGQRQRVALARALAKEPKLLLLDEPMAALDKRLREQMRFELVNIQRRVGITFIMVTHDQEEAMTTSSRIAVMEAGRIVQLGTPNEIYEHPVNRSVAEFIGTVNIFSGTVRARDEQQRLIIDCPELPTPLLSEHPEALAAQTAVAVAVRPEKISLNRQPPAQAYNCVEGHISGVAYMGDVSIYQITLSNGRTLTAQWTNRNRTETQSFAQGVAVHLSWQPNGSAVLPP